MRLLQSPLDQTLQQAPQDAFAQLSQRIDSECIAGKALASAA
ncbi:hypothetical protein [Roseateles sp. P5_E4]